MKAEHVLEDSANFYSVRFIVSSVAKRNASFFTTNFECLIKSMTAISLHNSLFEGLKMDHPWNEVKQCLKYNIRNAQQKISFWNKIKFYWGIQLNLVNYPHLKTQFKRILIDLNSAIFNSQFSSEMIFLNEFFSCVR